MPCIQRRDYDAKKKKKIGLELNHPSLTIEVVKTPRIFGKTVQKYHPSFRTPELCVSSLNYLIFWDCKHPTVN